MIPNYGYNPYLQFNNPQPSQDERIWVQNATSAEAYLLAPNGFVRLWDSNQPVFYEKRADATGRPLPMDVFEYKRKQPQSGAINGEMDKSMTTEIKGQIEALTQRIEALENKRGTKNVKSNADDGTI